MKDNIYTIKNLCDELNQPRQKVRRRLEKLEIKAINEDTRTYENEPLEYDHQAFLKLSEELGVSKFKKDKANETRDDTRSDTHEIRDDTQKLSDDINKDKVIEVLERELEHSKDKLRKSEEEKETLMRLLDQQQRLSLQANQKIEILESKDQEIKEEIKDDKKRKWWQFFK